MSIDVEYAELKADIALVRNQIREVIKPGSIEDSLCKGFTIWYSKITLNAPVLFIGINPGSAYYNHTGVKYRENDLDPSDVFEYCEYGGGLAGETLQVFNMANRLPDLEKSVKINIHYLVTSNQKELFLLQGILVDKYKKIEWKDNVCQFVIKNQIPIYGYKRLFSRIINKEELARVMRL
jgi:hypothetical protein